MTPKPPTDDPRWDRLVHLVAGEVGADEAAELRRWVEADPERREALARLEVVWQATAPSADSSPDAWDAEAELHRIRGETDGAGRVIARVGQTLELESVPGRRGRFRSALRIAAMLAVIAGGALLWRIDAPGPAATSSAPVAMIEYRTTLGQRLSLGLPDGTRVLLAPGSVLRRPATYGVHNRSVYLEGEGYFIVTHDADRPFAVHTARAIARDLGTRFVVRAYPEDAATDVIVSEGSVDVARPHSADRLLVRPHQRATVTAERSTLTSDVALGQYFNWTEGRLVFERTPLRDAVRQLERWYGINIQLADSALGGRRLTATLQEEGSVEAVDLVATSLELAVSRAGNTYVLRRTHR